MGEPVALEPPCLSLEPPADLPVRAAARFIDMLVLTAIQVVFGWLLNFSFLWLGIGALLVLAYFVGFDVQTGATPGKRFTHLKVVAAGGRRLTLEEAAKREAFVLLGAIPFIGLPLALAAWAYIAYEIHKDPSRRGPHDGFAGGTQVVYSA